MHLVLVDGSGFIFRAFHALPPMTRPDGTPVNAVFGFTNMLARLLKDHTGSHLAVIFDAGRTTFRNRIYDQYKAHRPEPPDELRPQFALVRDATLAFNVPAIELEDWEADDLIAAYTLAATNAGGQVTIVSSDKDLMQLIRPGVMMQDPIKQKMIGPAEVIEKFGCGPEKMTDLLALMGDSVDNVPGVPGIGPKTACQLLAEFGDAGGRAGRGVRHEALQAPGIAADPRRAGPPVTPARGAARRRAFAGAARLAGPARTRPAVLEHLAACAGLPQHRHPPGSRWPGADDAAPASAPAETAAAFGPYETLVTADQLAAWLAQVGQAGTLTLHAALEGKRLVGLGLAVSPGRAIYVPLAHQGDLERQVQQLDPAVARTILDPVLADPSVLKMFHDAKADLLALSPPGSGRRRRWMT